MRLSEKKGKLKEQNRGRAGFLRKITGRTHFFQKREYHHHQNQGVDLKSPGLRLSESLLVTVLVSFLEKKAKLPMK